ncbi:MAG TPA: hypothetical protein VFP59_05005 [Candidatus Angelobacter sp.]|nr:hypothetical protein [Candidatus Angelobacter sp.]
MKCGWTRVLLSAILLASVPLLAVDGMFQGRVVDAPPSVTPHPGWIFVQGRNHMLRRVEVAHAVIDFGNDIPISQRHKCNFRCIEVGQEVRIVAEQDGQGEWRAKRVEILRLVTNHAQSAQAPRMSLGG